MWTCSLVVNQSIHEELEGTASRGAGNAAEKQSALGAGSYLAGPSRLVAELEAEASYNSTRGSLF